MGSHVAAPRRCSPLLLAFDRLLPLPLQQLTPAELVALAAEPKKKHGHHGHHGTDGTDNADNAVDGGEDEKPYLVFVGDSIVAGQLQVCVG